ncbi:MAG: deoxyribodipyrimidine photo-lyase [Verrucomicrobiia bacterium]
MRRAPAIVWFRLDLRLADNPALHAAVQRGGPVIPAFVWSPEEEAPWEPGTASRWWCCQSLRALDADLRAIGSRLVLRPGPSLQALQTLVRETGASALFWNRRYEPAVIKRDSEIDSALRAAGLETACFDNALLHRPDDLSNSSGRPFQVFGAFWRACLSLPPPKEPLPRPRSLPACKAPSSLTLDSLEVEARPGWHPGESGAHSRLEQFLAAAFSQYATGRDFPALNGTSRLSPHLHFGEINPRQIWHAVGREGQQRRIPEKTWRASKFLAELGWREFAHHLLWHFPSTPEHPLRPEFNRFPWRNDPSKLTAWQDGATGYPIVDAGMRELRATGWMHNRVRMITASFLVKDLLISWQIGARWFWDTLVDADLAQNTLGWQWTAGCGADAAPFFRIFNPVLQGRKFDPDGAYVRQWVPELAKLPDKWLHEPWTAPDNILSAAGVKRGRTYPEPVISHTIAREVALEAFQRIR